MQNIGFYWKALIAFIVPAAGIIIGAVLENSPGGESITMAEWITAVATAIITAGATYSVPNADNVARKTVDGKIVATAATPGIQAGTLVDISPVGSVEMPDGAISHGVIPDHPDTGKV